MTKEYIKYSEFAVNTSNTFTLHPNTLTIDLDEILNNFDNVSIKLNEKDVIIEASLLKLKINELIENYLNWK